jgi:pimeloyl-ACP methyl ester carboxylesterase
MKLAQRIVLGYYTKKLRLLESVSLTKAAESAFELLCTPYTRKRTYDLPPIFKKAEKQSFTFQHYKIHGLRWKPAKANGSTLLICHGFDSASYRFEKYINPLLAEGFEILAFDAPAHGLSTGKTINVLLYRDFILEVIKNYGPIHALMAHSFGGVAAALTIEQPTAKDIKRLVLIAPATETSRSIADFCKALKISERLKQALEDLIMTIGGQPVSWYSVARVIKEINIPTLWIHDRKDSITPYEDMKHLEEMNLPKVTFEITEGLGHSLYTDEKIAETIIRFLAQIKTEV